MYMNNRGLSFIEILISLAFFSFLIFGIMSWMGLLTKESLNSKEDIFIANAMVQTRYALGDSDLYCTQVIGRNDDNSLRDFDTTNPSGITCIQAIDFYDQTLSHKLANVMTVNKALDPSAGTLLKEIRLRPVTDLGKGLFVSSLEMTFSKNSLLGAKQVVRKMPLYVVVNNGKIVKCSTQPATFMVISSQCSQSNDGYSNYNPGTQSCDLIQGAQWYKSHDSTKASCPSGTVPAFSPEEAFPEKVVCRSDSTSGPVITSRTYLSGYTDSSQIVGWVASWDPVQQQCLFAYMAGSTPIPDAAEIKCFDSGAVR